MTHQFGLTLLAGGQAQKHVTVNEALAKLDAMAQLRLVSRAVADPPGAPVDGAAYAVPVGAFEPWSAHEGEIAIYANGGWSYVAPKVGWSAWVEDEGVRAVFDGAAWQVDAMALAVSGAATRHAVLEVVEAVPAGASHTTLGAIPAGSVVLGVTGRVVSDLGADWSLGVPGATDRYGSGYGGAAGSFARGLTGQPQAYYALTSLVLTAAGSFTGGSVRLAVHCWTLEPPRA